jgi:hypothetical protein
MEIYTLKVREIKWKRKGIYRKRKRKRREWEIDGIIENRVKKRKEGRYLLWKIEGTEGVGDIERMESNRKIVIVGTEW